MATRRKPIKIKKPGSLRKALGASKGKPIAMSKVRAAAKGKGKTAARARFYLNVLRKGSRKKR
jgi:hypothetical protein